MSESREYGAWKNMRYRCNKPSHKFYKWYGERGITVSSEWNESFSAFYRDMGPRPSNNHSLERIDNSAGYSRENCRWETKANQQLNRRVYRKTKSDLPRGVVKNPKSTGGYIVHIWIDRIAYHVGIFPSVEIAKEEYRKIYFEWRGKNPPE